MSTDTVNVVIPVYNGAPYLGEAIDSVLAQTYPSIDLCVVDDGSTDGSGAIAQAYGPVVTYTRQSRAGNGAARNRGIRLSDAGVFSFLDADDRWVPEKLTIEVETLMADQALDGVRGRIREFVSPEISAEAGASIRAPLSSASLRSTATRPCTAPHSSPSTDSRPASGSA